MKSFSLLLVGLLFFSCNSPAQKSNTTENKTFEVTKTDAEWKAQLSPEAYQVLRHEATEPAFSKRNLCVRWLRHATLRKWT